jgi:hypothetical protein
MIDVHEADRVLVLVDDRGRHLTGDDLAEEAVRVAHGGGNTMRSPWRRWCKADVKVTCRCYTSISQYSFEFILQNAVIDHTYAR